MFKEKKNYLFIYDDTIAYETKKLLRTKNKQNSTYKVVVFYFLQGSKGKFLIRKKVCSKFYILLINLFSCLPPFKCQLKLIRLTCGLRNFPSSLHLPVKKQKR